jgi:rhodanese-related sulfurtransferase
MSSSVAQMIAAANEVVPRITAAQAKEMLTSAHALVLDVRDPPEVEKTGRVPGSVAVSRGMLEFRADPESPSHDPAFSRERTVLVYCGSGGRAALAGKALKDLGYERVYNIGGLKDVAEALGPLV